MKKLQLILATSILLSFSAPSYAAHDASKICSVETKVNGLVCDFCARALNKVFKKQEAVKNIDVNLDKGLVSIFLKPNKNLSDKKITKLITDAGYNVASLNRNACK